MQECHSKDVLDLPILLPPIQTSLFPIPVMRMVFVIQFNLSDLLLTFAGMFMV